METLFNIIKVNSYIQLSLGRGILQNIELPLDRIKTKHEKWGIFFYIDDCRSTSELEISERFLCKILRNLRSEWSDP